MRVQNIDNNVSCKGLYFTNRSPIIKENVHFADPRGVKVSKLGARYMEDNSAKLTFGVKKLFANNPAIKALQKTRDVFVQYFGENYDKDMKSYQSRVRLYVLENGANHFNIADFVANDKNSEIAARAKLLNKLT